MKISFRADSVKVTGPHVDGSYRVSFSTGEYERERVAEILKIPPQTELEVIVQPGGN